MADLTWSGGFGVPKHIFCKRDCNEYKRVQKQAMAITWFRGWLSSHFLNWRPFPVSNPLQPPAAKEIMSQTLLGCTRMYLAVLGCARLYQAIPDCTRLDQAVLTVPGCTWMYKAVLGCTRLCQAALGCHRLYKAEPDCIWLHQAVPGPTWL